MADSSRADSPVQLNHVVIPAGGIGQRMGADRPKQYLKINGRMIIDWSIRPFIHCSEIQSIWVALAKNDPYWSQTESCQHAKVHTVIGGPERVYSVLNALNALRQVASDRDWVWVHDAARPCLHQQDIQKLLQCEQGLLASPVRDTMKRDDSQGRVQNTVERQGLWHALTPQKFQLGLLIEAIQFGLKQGLNLTDESSAMEAIGQKPHLIEGRSDNIKITRPIDLKWAEFFLKAEKKR